MELVLSSMNQVKHKAMLARRSSLRAGLATLISDTHLAFFWLFRCHFCALRLWLAVMPQVDRSAATSWLARPLVDEQALCLKMAQSFDILRSQKVLVQVELEKFVLLLWLRGFLLLNLVRSLIHENAIRDFSSIFKAWF